LVGARVEEPPKERPPRLDQAGLLRRAFAVDVFRASAHLPPLGPPEQCGSPLLGPS
jgi:hypothetical protein